MGKNVLVSFNGTKNIQARIALTGSKSECNRALVISALSNGAVKVENQSNAADTVTLGGILTSLAAGDNTGRRLVDVGPAGTAMRFLTAYLAVLPGKYHLTGTERMKQRPIGVLVDALRSIGANINYAGEPGFPPLDIDGGFAQTAARVEIAGDISSQYLSALLMVAPQLPQGLELQIKGELTSRPYVQMTLDMLAEAGIRHEWNGNRIVIRPQTFSASNLTVEPDWSAASYWYSIAALAAGAALELPALRAQSLQGDSRIRQIMQDFGVSTTQIEKGISLSKGPQNFPATVLDLKDCPDLAQTIVVCAAAMGKNLSFTGLETLKIKETDRIAALQNELAQLGVTLTEDNKVYTLNCDNLHFPDRIFIRTYEDHRMAMAFAPLALLVREVEIEEANVVAKSYPDFWAHLEQAGFNVTSV
ncbi:3-phosphoshikimate 1-carboxyvinyltransferase [Pedobacter yulinensis]|uniref:3-phosphoshikimate 1-carboxyvinyltransferase n=1 Tax=Pedobacter yulinensis TaxID=2126353 RepID=A0A2T3HMQ4_9SPHI|nr:3-phosphoshikimate 1-carboxyvinyltransferase [Pedobacter yulinensis]PST83719.1 3-phosphoshikimate 1-carboxyvinyltransferase [Pedobacter yulinensis]